MLSHVLCERFDAYSLGLHIGRDDAYVDLAGADAAPMTRALADELEAEVNAWIAQDEPVRCFFPTPEELEALPLAQEAGPPPGAAHRLHRLARGGRLLRHARALDGPGPGPAHPLLAAEPRQPAPLLCGGGCARCAGPGRGPSRRRARRASSPAGRRTSSRPWTGFAHRTQTWRTALRSLRASGSPAQLTSLAPVPSPAGPLYAACLEGADADGLREGLALLTRREGAVCFLCAPSGEGYAVALGAGPGARVHAGQALRAVLAELGGKGGGRADSAFGRCARMDLAAVLRVLGAQGQ